MIRILYFSTAQDGITDADVDGIVAHASDRNRSRNITGALAFNGRNFCQCLEGDEADINKLMDTISADPRHAGLKVLDQKDIRQRYFADWTMQQVDGLDFSTVIDAMKA